MDDAATTALRRRWPQVPPSVAQQMRVRAAAWVATYGEQRYAWDG